MRLAAQPAAAVNPDGTYNETTGGNANTWTNYTNAGGQQGPTIGAFATIEIACVVQGFRVANGNTNWYLIASSPWSYHYYVSADPFYNNGQTSGPIKGTPWVDTSVPSCNAGVSGVGETAGGAANTWTNYTNAGGQQGPTIGGGSTVVMACKLSGFRVADGNTWWYQIASHPWNNSYYVSADAFYNNGQTSGSLKGTPFVDPNVPTCSTGGTGGGGGGSGTVNETVGGNSNTWSNYANAGGNQGPTIPNGATVGITCKLTGFRVTDGNTWWYEIGSSPWNNNYFVSADAFYNNGSTSGSLRGTPFVDPAVPDCTPSGGGSGNTRPNTETAGGNANTWTNYSHAGGTQGPTISAGSPVVVTCRAQGFRVADGNTWWYLIASAPWSNVFYVSADPFYNNGATSGSLSGTPFYDPTVPVCVNNQEAPLYSTSFATGHATSHTTTCTYGHYPVNCASGDFWHTFTDVSLAGRGPDLTLTRTYNSLAPGSSNLFGYGWSSSWDQHLIFNSGGRTDGSIVVALADGSQLTATPDGTGGYATPPATDSTFKANPDGTYTLTQHQLAIETFAAAGQLLALSDLDGNMIGFSYNSSGQLTTVTDGAGRCMTVTTNADGLATSLTDPMGRTTTYAYDSGKNLTAVTDALSRTWTYTYDANHRMLTMTDPRGGVVTNTYDVNTGQITKQVDPAGLATTLAYTGDNYGSVGGTTTITDPHGNTRLEQYVNGFLTQVTRALGTTAQATWSYAYDPNNFGQTTATDPNGHTTVRTYDAVGHELTSTDPLGNTTTHTYNALGQQLTTTTPLGNTTTNTYDTAGNLLTTTDPAGNTTTYGYSPVHPSDLTSLTDPDGRSTRMTYDGYGNLSSRAVSPAAGVSDTTNFVYDADSDLVCQATAVATGAGKVCSATGTSPIAGTSTQTFDAAGQMTSAVDAAGHTTSSTYDEDGNKTSTTDPAGNRTTTTYDGDNRSTSATTGASTPGASTARTTYDIAPGTGTCPTGGATTYCTTNTDPNGAVTTHVFDANDHELWTVRPGGQVTTYVYDPAGNRVSRTAPSGVVTHYSYDADNRLTSITYSDGATPTVAYSYDADGRRIAMTDGTGTTSYSYDPAGRRTSITNGAGATISYSYDAAGHVVAIGYPNGKSVRRAFDGAGRMTSLTDWLGHTTTYAYDADDNTTSTTYGNGDTAASTYDIDDQLLSTTLSSATHTTLAALQFARDTNNRVTSETDTGALTGAPTYGYDANGRLNAVGATPYAYDAANNPTTFGPVTQQYAADDSLTSTASSTSATTYAYDASGNRISAISSGGDEIDYSYDAENRLTTVSEAGSAPTVTRLSATSGSAAGGKFITITGAHFTPGSTVRFGTAPATDVVVTDPTSLTATIPAGTGTVDVTVTTPLGTSSTGPSDAYSYISVASITPASGPTTGGQVVTIHGAGLGDATRVNFGSTAIKAITHIDPATLSVVSPAHTAGPATVTVTTPEGVSAGTNSSTYTYTAGGPVVTGVAPSAGPVVGGGKAVVITGSGLTGATAVYFGTTPATSFTANSSAKISAVAPAGGPGRVDVTVTTAGGTSLTSASDGYTYLSAPVLTAVSPSSGPAGGGQSVTLSGQNLTGATTVKFGSKVAAYTVSSATQIIATSPPGTAGKIKITVTTAGGTSKPATYTYTIASSLIRRHVSAHRTLDGEKAAAVGSTGVASYTYNGDGLRTTTTTTNSTSVFTYDTTTAVPTLVGDGNNWYLYGPDGLPAEQISPANTAVYYTHDQIGSTRVLTDDNGAVAASYTYRAFGRLAAETGTVTTPLQFSSGYSDDQTYFTYLIDRFYDPNTRQFISVDPLVTTTRDAYGYAGDDPVNMVDRSGDSWYNPFSWTKPTWNTVNYAIGFVPGVGLVWGGVQALGGYASATGTCFGYGWASDRCSDATWNATMQALTFGVSSYFHTADPDGEIAINTGQYLYSQGQDTGAQGTAPSSGASTPSKSSSGAAAVSYNQCR